MLAELATIALTTKALFGIICGVGGGGLVVGGAMVYAINKLQSSPEEIDLEYKKLDAEASFQGEKRQRSLNTTCHRISLISEETMQGHASNQKKGASVIDALEIQTISAEKNHESGRAVIDETLQENEKIKQLMSELKSKTEQLGKITEDYKALQNKLNDAVGKLEQALAELNLLKETIYKISGERDYNGQVIKVLKRMKSSNSELKNKLEIHTQKYEQALQLIEVRGQQLQRAKATIFKQGKIILSLQENGVNEVLDRDKKDVPNARFFNK